MIITKIPFDIDFPLRILKKKKVNFDNQQERRKIFKRNIYYYKFMNVKNQYLEERSKIFLDLGRRISKVLKMKYPQLKILNVSIFGSALYNKNNDDFDFLIITEGNIFRYEKLKLKVDKSGQNKFFSVGVSIKGLENLSKGIFDNKSKVSLNFQSQILYRTTISLFRRHIPLIGYDFENNRKVFLKNVHAQISDLLNNAYELYFVNNEGKKYEENDRSRKMLSRTYESISYLKILRNDIRVNYFRKKVANKINKKTSLEVSKKIIYEMIAIYEREIKHVNKGLGVNKNFLKFLLNKDLKENVAARLKNYWAHARLPYLWIDPILEILKKYSYSEQLGIEMVRKKFPQIRHTNSPDYGKKLEYFRKIKVKNLAKRIVKNISKEPLADVGGRTDDLVEQILILNKNIKISYVTDLFPFIKISKNPKINFIVQPSATKIPFEKNSVGTVIMCMVLHHLSDWQQKEMIKNLFSYLKIGGKMIIIEDTFPKNIPLDDYDLTTKKFMKFSFSERKHILYFYDWFGNKIMRGRDDMPFFHSYKTMDKWKETFNGFGLKQIESEFIKENKDYPDIFPPKGIMVFQKR